MGRPDGIIGPRHQEGGRETRHCVVKPGTVKQCDQFNAQVYLMTPEEGGRKKPCTADMQLMVFSKTWDCAAFVSLVGKDMAMPGEDASMNLRLMKPMVLEEGQQFTIRDSTGTIGTGKVTTIMGDLTDEDKQLMMMNKSKRAKVMGN